MSFEYKIGSENKLILSEFKLLHCTDELLNLYSNRVAVYKESNVAKLV